MLHRSFIGAVFFFSLLFLTSCQLPPAMYVLNAPLAFNCSTNYNPDNGINAEWLALWSENCPNTANTWIRFSVYADKSDISGFLFYTAPTSSTSDYAFFLGLVRNHIVNGVIVPNTENIVNFIADDECSSKDPNGIERGDAFPSIYLIYPTKYPTSLGYSIQGLNNIANRQASVIIPPLTCLGQGSFVVTTVDYINMAESIPSNILVLS